MSGAVARQIFTIARSDGTWLLYAPLRRCVAAVNEAAVSAVAKHLDGGDAALDPAEREIIETLRLRGFFEDDVAAPVFPGNYGFCPHEVTLFPTSRCNLRCRYCYADAGRKSVEMPWDVARAAIDLVATNAGLLGAPKFAVGFHGGGEPTLAWDMLVRASDYAREKAGAMGLDVELFCATNGVLSQAQRDYFVKHFTTLNVSLDGPPDIQDRNRPLVGGGGSFERVAESLKHFDEAGLHYGIRATIVAATVARAVEIVDYLAAQFHTRYLHLEPAWFCGRCVTSGERPPSDDEFARHFLAATRRGRELGLDVFYSGARLDVLTSKFCGAPGDGFTVLPEGIATSCYEVTEPDDRRAAMFHYGRFNPASERFTFDETRLAALRRLSVENLPFCRDCFCKWHCAGDCLAKAFEQSASSRHEGTTRCDLNRALTLAELESLVQDVGLKEA